MMMERESGEASGSQPMELIRRVPAPATRDQTEGTLGEESKSVSSRRIGGVETTGGVVPGEIPSKAWRRTLNTLKMEDFGSSSKRSLDLGIVVLQPTNAGL